MTEPTRAVFLSYASQDAEAAKRICGALRSGGIEVWFDQSELRGGDAWDAAIRKQIKACALFVPVISANTHAREEGYFRLEWKLAVDRSHLMTGTKAFLLPVVIDNTRDDDEHVPDKFRELHWTRLPAGQTPPTFVERVSHLLSPEHAHEPTHAHPPAGAAPGAGSAATAGPTRVGLSRRTNPALVLIAAVAVLGVGYFAFNRFVVSKRVAQPVVSGSTPASPTPSTIPEKSIAVLPFIDMSEKKDQEYFSDGLAEELLDLLGQVPDLHVPARTSSFYFKGQHVTVAEIGRTLGVMYVLEGSVRKSGNTVRVTTQLIRADSGYQLWSKTYDRDLKDIFKVQDEIAAAVVEALKARLLATQEFVNQHRTEITEAYEQYLLAKELYNHLDVEGLGRAAIAAKKAIDLDPQYASAYGMLAASTTQLRELGGHTLQTPAEDLIAADRAVALAPRLAEVYSQRGYVRLYHWDWSGARTDLERAMQLDPRDGSARRRFCVLMESLGHFPEATAAAEASIALDPLDPSNWNCLGISQFAAGDYAAARAAVTRALELSPNSVRARNFLARTELLDDKPREALKTFGNVQLERWRLSGQAMAEYTLGQAQESRRVLEQLIAGHSQDAATNIAEVYAWRHEPDKAFEWLERAFEQHDSDIFRIKSNRFFVILRTDPRYSALLRKMNLPE